MQKFKESYLDEGKNLGICCKNTTTSYPQMINKQVNYTWSDYNVGTNGYIENQNIFFKFLFSLNSDTLKI